VRCGSDATLFCKHKQTNLKNKPNVRLVGKFKKREVSRLVKYKNREANPKNKPKMSKFAQQHAQISFCSMLKEQNGHEIW